jgi:beta-glucosidase
MFKTIAMNNYLRVVSKIWLISLILVFNGFVSNAQNAYQNTSLPVEERVTDLISRMTLAEKISQLGNQSSAITRLGIKSYDYWNEAIHGVARSGLATSFPQSLSISSTWNPALIYEIATAISDEARVKNNTDGKGLTYWCPTINMARDPRWGRTEENYGEDTYLTSQLAVNFIRGMQGNDPKYLKTVATAKHFACNNIEANRYGISSNVDERSLREYYLPAFKACVTEGKVFSVMSAYNAVNGVPSSANRTLLTNILRNEWGFKGYVVSDCDAVGNVWDSHKYVATGWEATAISLKNGTDLNCGGTFPNNAKTGITNGVMSENDINIALKRVFAARFLLGEFDPAAMVPYRSISKDLLDCQAHRDLALKAAREGIVLLKNQNSILPLNAESVKTIAVIGPNANVVQLGGYSGSPSVSVTPLSGIATKLGVDISNGTIEAEFFTNQNGIQTEGCSEGGSNIGYIENGDYTEYDNIDFGTGKSMFAIRVASNSTGGNVALRLDGPTGELIGTFPVSGTGGWQNWVTISNTISEITGIHKVFLKFTGGSGYLFNVNWLRFYNSTDPDPLAGGGRLRYAMGCSIQGAKDQVAFDQAVELARISDVAIVVCGTDLSVADESHDRNSLNLPGVQEELIKAVYNANPKTIVVLVNGCPLAINWTQDNVPAILAAGYAGQAQGTAIADVLFGHYNPKGKLSTTWFKSLADLPSMNDYNIKNNRTYMYFKGTPLYPFGYGLSYTTFEYSNLKLNATDLNLGDSIVISADIKNNGKVAGEEIAQLYVHAVSSPVLRPIKELKGFKSIHLQPGETGTVYFTLKHNSLSYYDEESKTFVVANGVMDILVGASSQDIRIQNQINVGEGTVGLTYRQDPFSVTEAENFENKTSSVKIEARKDGGQCISMTGNKSYVVYKNFNFTTEALQFDASLSSIVDSQSSIELVLDSLDGQVAGTLKIAKTGTDETYTVQSCTLSVVRDVRDVYLVFKTKSASTCKINWFRFQKEIGTAVNTINSADDYKLSIYPNPSSGDITLKYKLPTRSDVKIDVYSTQGQLIRSVVKKKQEAGEFRTKIIASNSVLKTGSYILCFNANQFSKSLLFEVTE